VNNVTAKKNADSSVAVQFGGCDGQIPNCLPTAPARNYMVRLFRPRAEVLNGTWRFPEAQRVNLTQVADMGIVHRCEGFQTLGK
jgi:hypothetical protein